jgi:amino acid transporter
MRVSHRREAKREGNGRGSVASSRAHRSGWASLADFILGRRLANREYGERKIGALEGVPAMGLDGLGSAAYGPEAALTILMPLGATGLAYFGWVMAPIVALLAILFASYWQTIVAYPSNGGAYIVSKQNLGQNASLLAAAALMIDYVLNVAVGISAGVGALVSAIPALHPHILALCLAILAIVTLANLRGTMEASRAFALPTYLFIASFLVIIAVGIARAVASGGHPPPVVAPPPLGPSTEAVSLWLLLRAFASGCTAMTGVEAVSNGMSAFRDPRPRYGHRTLTAICVILGCLLAGIAMLARSYGIGAMDQTRAGYQSVLSQLAQAVVGRGALYDIAIGALLCVLTLSANTSFVGFPRLCHLVAQDGFLPKPFAVSGRRLVFSVGILYLACCAGALLIVFGGITDRLIPLFAIGAFLTFTLSQAGMVVHWRKMLRGPSPSRTRHETRAHLALNAAGALTTGVALIIIVTAKFTEGAWITVLVIPLVIWMLKSIHGYYAHLARALHDASPLDLADLTPPVVVVTAEHWDKLTDNALQFAMTLSPEVIGVHLTQLSGPDAEEEDRTLRAAWAARVEEPARAAGRAPPRLMILPAPKRAMDEPLLKLVRELRRRFGARRIAMLIPELVKAHWYDALLHTGRAARLRRNLLRLGDPDLTVIAVPWRV